MMSNHVSAITTRRCTFLFAALMSVNLPTNAEVPENPLRNPYFGETHVHTAYSLDAYLGGTRLTPSDAYRHAKGESVVVNGKPHRSIGRINGLLKVDTLADSIDWAC